MSATPVFVCDDHTDRAAWVVARRLGIGGSDAPCIMGLVPQDSTYWAGPAEIAAEKRGLMPERDETELMAWGRKVEPLLIETFLEDMEKAGKKGWSAKVCGRMYRHGNPTRAFMQATLDGKVRDPDGRVGVIECKLVRFKSETWEREGIPEHVICQSQHNAEVADAAFTLIIGLLDGYRPRWKIMARHRDLMEASIWPAELDFWTRYQTGEAFPIDVGPTASGNRVLSVLYPQDSGARIRLAGQKWLDDARTWALEKANEAAAKDRKERAKLRLRDAIGSATFADLDGGAVLSLKKTRRADGKGGRVLREVDTKRRGRR